MKAEKRGCEIELQVFVNSDHAGDRMTSQTDILVFLSHAPIVWISKRKNSVQTSTFGAKFSAMSTAVETVQSVRFKLRSFGVEMANLAKIYCDNEAAFKNISKPESVLMKKEHDVAYHFCPQAVASGMIRVVKENSETNLADFLPKR